MRPYFVTIAAIAHNNVQPSIVVSYIARVL